MTGAQVSALTAAGRMEADRVRNGEEGEREAKPCADLYDAASADFERCQAALRESRRRGSGTKKYLVDGNKHTLPVTSEGDAGSNTKSTSKTEFPPPVLEENLEVSARTGSETPPPPEYQYHEAPPPTYSGVSWAVWLAN